MPTCSCLNSNSPPWQNKVVNRYGTCGAGVRHQELSGNESSARLLRCRLRLHAFQSRSGQRLYTPFCTLHGSVASCTGSQEHGI